MCSVWGRLMRRIRDHGNLCVPARAASVTCGASGWVGAAVCVAPCRADPAARVLLGYFAGGEVGDGGGGRIGVDCGNPDGQICGECALASEKGPDNRVFPRREPMVCVGGALAHLHNVPEVPEALYVSAVMPAEEGRPPNEKLHRAHPLWMPESAVSPREGALHGGELVPATCRIAAGTNGSSLRGKARPSAAAVCR